MNMKIILVIGGVILAIAAWQALPRHRGKQKPRVICAWCEPGPYPPGVSHGICERHRNDMLAEVRKLSGELPGKCPKSKT